MRAGRIELPSRPWQGRVLPINHARNVSENYSSRTLLFSPENYCAPGGIRTPNSGSEDRCDIHFTTGAFRLNQTSSLYHSLIVSL